MRLFRVFCDYDGVLVDFNSAACQVHEVCPKKVEKSRHPGEWSLLRPLNIVKGRRKPMTLDAFWTPIVLGQEKQFWADLKRLPWFDDMHDLLERMCHYRILTDPCLAWATGATVSGKIESLRRNFGKGFDSFHITGLKEDFARPMSILIDDRDENVKKFRLFGGLGIVFPTKGGSKHEYADDPVTYVKQQLKEMGAI